MHFICGKERARIEKKISQGNAPQSFQQATATPTKREPVASRLRNQGMAFSPTLKHGDVMDGQFPMIEVLNPQDGSPAYVFRAWRPSDIKDIAEWLPDPSVVGGAAFATALQELVQQHKASISEVRQLCTYSQGDMPGRDEAKKLQLAQLEALENPKPTRRNRDQRLWDDGTVIITPDDGTVIIVEPRIIGSKTVRKKRERRTPDDGTVIIVEPRIIGSKTVPRKKREAKMEGGIRIDGTQEQTRSKEEV